MWISLKRYKELRVFENVNRALMNTINSLEDENGDLKVRIKERDKMLSEQLNHERKLESRLIDMNNNIVFLVNNLSPAKQRQIKSLPCPTSRQDKHIN